MSGVLVDRTAPGPPWEQPPVLDAGQQTLVNQLVSRRRPLVGGVKIVGPIWGPGTTVGHGLEYSGTLGLLLQDANDPAIAYGITALHVLAEGVGAWSGTLQIGHSVFQPTQTGKGILAGLSRIGWLIARYEELDLALIGIRPNLRWSPQIGPAGPATAGGSPFTDHFDEADFSTGAGSRTVTGWTFDPAPVMGALPTSGPPVSKVGARSGRTTGLAYRLSANTSKYLSVPRPPATGGSLAGRAAWNLLEARYLNDPTMADSVILASTIDPLLYLCPPDPVGTSSALTAFQLKGDSGAALLDQAGGVVGIINDLEKTDVTARQWMAGLAVPIDIVLGTLQAAIADEYGAPSGSDWPMLALTAGTTGEVRRVPKTPRWYALAQAQIQAVSL